MPTNVVVSVDTESSPSVFTMAVAQSLALLSLKFPLLDRHLALVWVLLVPTAPLVATIVCYVLGYWIPAIIFGVLLVGISSLSLYMAGATLNNIPKVSPKAVRALQYRANQTRLVRYTGFDLYKPPGSALSQIKSALLLIPETLVDCASYAEIAGKLSDKGVLVVVLNTRPYFMPCTLVGATLTNLQSVMSSVSKTYKVQQWAIGGHGMGARPAAVWANKLNMSRLVLWGVYTMNQDLSDSNINVLSVMASKDGHFLNKSKQDIALFQSRLPPDAADAVDLLNSSSTIYCMITGGNHAGFCTMDGVLSNDGEAEISVEQQHKICVNTTAMFLLHSQKSFRYQAMNDDKNEDEEDSSDGSSQEEDENNDNNDNKVSKADDEKDKEETKDEKEQEQE